MTDNMQSEAPIKRRIGRPSVDGSQPSPILFARVPPATLEAVKREIARRGMVPSALVREALDLLLKDAGERLAAA
jgi:hypothetical protein